MGLAMGDDAGEGLSKPEKAIDEAETLTIDEAVDRIYKGVTLKLFLVFSTAVSSNYVTAAATYITIFAGFIPYTEWECVSEKCTALLAESGYSQDFYSSYSMCDNKLEAGTDFNWTSERTSFSVDWGFYCGTEAKLSVISSFFFIGACLGLLTSTAIFDRIGRRNGAVVGAVISAVATLAAVWIGSYEGMLAIRIVQGYGQFMGYTGVYCWIVEFSPGHLRNAINGVILFAWCLGYLVIVGMSYLIPTWQHIFLATAIFNFITIVPLLIYPISPRFALVRGREDEAKRTLVSYSRICNNEITLDTVNLVYEKRVQNFWQQLKDFKIYPTMLKETLLGMTIWFVLGALFYGFSFGWGKMGKDLYTSYLFAALGKVLALFIMVVGCKYMGRKKATLLFFVVGILSNLLAMPDVNFSSRWTLEHISCLIGSMFITSAFALMYLYTSELAPTTHRGMIMSLSSSSARVGSFIGPYVNLLYGITDRRVTLAVFAAAGMICVLAVFFLSDTTDRSIPETPDDVETLNKKFGKFVKVENQADCAHEGEKF